VSYALILLRCQLPQLCFFSLLLSQLLSLVLSLDCIELLLTQLEESLTLGLSLSLKL
jgi:hypothetical protein